MQFITGVKKREGKQANPPRGGKQERKLPANLREDAPKPAPAAQAAPISSAEEIEPKPEPAEPIIPGPANPSSAGSSPDTAQPTEPITDHGSKGSAGSGENPVD
jgi:hypothetical protein